jgi:hypothetical protein
MPVKMTSSFAFNAGPSLLKFHPKFSSVLLVASASGTFTLADASGSSFSPYQQVRAHHIASQIVTSTVLSLLLRCSDQDPLLAHEWSNLPSLAVWTACAFPKLVSLAVSACVWVLVMTASPSGTGAQLQLQSESVTACGVSSSGEAIAFGTDAGCVHLWALAAVPRVNQYSQPLEVPPVRPGPPAVPLAEDDSFALAAVYPAAQV